MNKNFIIVGSLVALVFVGFGFWYLFSGDDTVNPNDADTTPTAPISQNPQQQNPPGQTQVEPGVIDEPSSVPPTSTYTYPWWIPYQPATTKVPSTQPPSTIPTQYSQAEVAAKDFKTQNAQYSDTVIADETIIVERYALQFWSDENTGGFALMRFDNQKSKWVIVESSGGSPSLEWLMSLGVSRQIAENLMTKSGF